MQKLAKSFLLITVALTAILLSSCSQPAGSSSGSSSGIDAYLNSDPITIETLYGTWKPTHQDDSWPFNNVTFSAPNIFNGVPRGNVVPPDGTFTLENDKLTVTLNTEINPTQDFKVIYKDNKLYITPYATNEQIKDSYNLMGSSFGSVEEFIKANCRAIYVKQ